jgi:hypothetical protein
VNVDKSAPWNLLSHRGQRFTWHTKHRWIRLWFCFKLGEMPPILFIDIVHQMIVAKLAMVCLLHRDSIVPQRDEQGEYNQCCWHRPGYHRPSCPRARIFASSIRPAPPSLELIRSAMSTSGTNALADWLVTAQRRSRDDRWSRMSYPMISREQWRCGINVWWDWMASIAALAVLGTPVFPPWLVGCGSYMGCHDNYDSVVMSLHCGCSRLWTDKKDKSYVCPSHLMLVSWCLVMLNTLFFSLYIR